MRFFLFLSLLLLAGSCTSTKTNEAKGDLDSLPASQTVEEMIKKGDVSLDFPEYNSRIVVDRGLYEKDGFVGSLRVSSQNNDKNEYWVLLTQQQSEKFKLCRRPFEGFCRDLAKELSKRLDWPTLEVKAGDTLAKISKRQCRTVDYAELRRANYPYGDCDNDFVDRSDKGLCFFIRVGSKLRLPPSCV